MEDNVRYKIGYNSHKVIEYRAFNDIETNHNRRYEKKYGSWYPLNNIVIDENDSETIKSYYGNPLVRYINEMGMVTIEDYGDKVSLRVYKQFKNRAAGSTYFRVRRQIEFLTYNLKTKNFYYGLIGKKNKQVIGKKCVTNPFSYTYINNLIYSIKTILETDVKFSDNTYESKITIDSIIKEYFKILEEKTAINFIVPENRNKINHIFKEFFLKHNGIKVPDSFSRIYQFSISKSILKKHGNFTRALFSIYELYGKKINIIFNDTTRFYDYGRVIFLFRTLGIDYFNQVDQKVYSNDVGKLYSESSQYIMEPIKGLSNVDKEKFVLALNLVNFNTVIDHFTFQKKLQNYNHIVKPKFNNISTFNREHTMWSELVDSYRKGKVTRYYGDDAKNKIEEIIFSFDGINYYPNLLTTTDEYNMESSEQNNCVRTYIEKSSCIIVSLRAGSPYSTDRATIEYQFRRNEIIRVQSLGKFNKTLSELWDSALEVLDNRMSLLYKEKIIQLPKMVKKYRSGTVIKRKSFFKKDDKTITLVPVWDNTEDVKEDIFDFFE